jgi:hypothetical protein
VWCVVVTGPGRRWPLEPRVSGGAGSGSLLAAGGVAVGEGAGGPVRHGGRLQGAQVKRFILSFLVFAA